ncbi:hypothetical protein HYY75_07170 [bacterium]|nr:hypothetical protein [bacterium]
MALIFFISLSFPGFANTSDFSSLHREVGVPTKDVILKKLLYVCGLMNGAYLGMNDLVAALNMKKNSSDPKVLSAQLFAVKIGLEDKPRMMRYISKEIRPCENYPNFPLGFPDSPEGPEPISVEFEKIADSLENLNICFQSNDIEFLKKEANRVTFTVFWTECEKIRAICFDLINFVRVNLKEDIPFEAYQRHSR